jgi:hypothetical protein
MLVDESGTAVPPEKREEYALSLFKRTIARECRFVPKKRTLDEMQRAVRIVDPAWVITTNYDLCFERLLTHSNTLLPNAPMPPSRRVTPVFHMHGHVLAPESIVITEADYVSAIRPFGYRQAKLATLFSESTTLILGYALSDMNVRSALDLSRSFGMLHRKPMIQIQWVPSSPNDAPYTSPIGTEVLEATDIASLLDEVADVVTKWRSGEAKLIARVDKIVSDRSERDLIRSDGA